MPFLLHPFFLINRYKRITLSARALLAVKMRVGKVLCISDKLTQRADIEFDLVRNVSELAMENFKKMIFGDEHIKLDNRVFPTCEEEPRANICVVFDSKSNTEGHGGYPVNQVVNEIFEETFSDAAYTFHGTVVMFYIDNEGTKISTALNVGELGGLIRSMKIAIDTHNKDIWQSQCFSDVYVAEPKS